ncbi:hypothetical protein HOLleu_21141 [Holothuria leucospilota]|uniref:Uncharacterized protein n=1 Tax=Holothuria leucospilota TaxID=206669 RepID=A0A9Q1H5T9_HOLLE|nr:hypothetical protein HOLleu_21141 [Holothuria leucospilota]
MSTKADIIFYGGSIITMDENISNGSEAIALAGGLILAVGNINAVFNYVGPNTQVIFLNEQTLMPGFIECHQHACLVALKNSTYTDISSVQYR